jgi:sortase A
VVHNEAVTDDEAPTPAGTTPPTQPGKRALRPEPEGPASEGPASEDAWGVVVADRPAGAEPEPDHQTDRETQPKPKRSGFRRITFWTGVGLILAGLGLLAYVAWQLWGTNWISKRHQREITSNLQEDWAAGEGCDTYCPHGQASALIRIPKFGKKYVVPVLEGTSQDILARGFGHFEDTANPGPVPAGTPANYVLAGHRVTHGEPLRHMPDLRPGDKVIVETRKFTYTYVLDTNPNDLVIPFTGTWVLDAIPHNPDPNGVNPNTKYKKLITLTTCSEIFHTDNRMIAFGHLVNTVRKTKLVPVNP